VAPSPRVAVTAAPGAVDARVPLDRRGTVVGSRASGWVQEISVPGLVGSVPRGSTVRLDVAAGSYVATGAPLATVWLPAGLEPGDCDIGAAVAAVRLGPERTLEQDPSFGLVQLEDIALRALSPGVNDPNTVRAVLPQIAEVVLHLLVGDPGADTAVVDGRTVFVAGRGSDDGYLTVAFEGLRLAAVGQPVVQLSLVRTLLATEAELARRGARPEASAAVRRFLDRVRGDVAHGGGPAGEEARRLLGSPVASDGGPGG
jgi:uncharacterized membrane protein